MAEKVPTKSGNPYHDEHSGEFVSPGDTSQIDGEELDDRQKRVVERMRGLLGINKKIEVVSNVDIEKNIEDMSDEEIRKEIFSLNKELIHKYNWNFSKIKDKKVELSQLRQMKKLVQQFPIPKGVLSLTNGKIVVEMNGRLRETMGYCRYHSGLGKIFFHNKISLSTKELKKDYNTIKEEIKSSQNSGWWSKTSEKDYVSEVITHEYGHLIAISFVSRIFNKNTYLDRRITLNDKTVILKAIKNKIDDEFAKKFPNEEIIKQIPEYGRTDIDEWFAETFKGGFSDEANEYQKIFMRILTENYKGE